MQTAAIDVSLEGVNDNSRTQGSGVSRPVGEPDITSHPQNMQLYGLVTNLLEHFA